MHMHTVAVVVDERLGHERCGLAVGVRDVVHDVLENLHLVRLAHQRIELHADLTLAGRGDLVVVYLGFEAELLECKTHRRTNVVQ